MGKGIDIRLDADELLFRAFLQDASGVIVTTGATTLKLYEPNFADGSLKSYDFNDNTFKTGALTTETLALTHRTGNNGTTNTGLWTARLATLTGFTKGGIYFAQVANAAAMPLLQTREFQYGGAQGVAFDNDDLASQIGQIGIGSASVSKTAGSAVITMGTETLTYLVTIPLDGVTHDVAPDGGVLDFYYEFNVGGGRTGSLIDWHGYVNGNNDVVDVFAWDWIATTWSQIGSIDGSPGSTIEPKSFKISTAQTGLGANAGTVRIRFESSGGDVITKIATDQILCSFAVTSQSVGYANGAIWYDDTAANTNTVPFVDGVADNPVSTWAAVLSLLSSIGLNRVETAGGSAVVLTGNSDKLELLGHHWDLDMGGQSLDDAVIEGAHVVGAQGGSGIVSMLRCHIGAVTGLRAELQESQLEGAIALAGDTTFFHCGSNVAGDAAPSLTFSGLGTTEVSFRLYSGGIELKAMEAGDTVSFDCPTGHIIYNANCNGGSVTRRGLHNRTDNTGGAITETFVAAIDRDYLDTLTATLEGRLTAARAGYLDKLNVSGTLAHSDAAATYRANVSSIAADAAIAVWRSILADHSGIAGSTAEALAAIEAASAPTVGEIDAKLTSEHGAGSWLAGTAAPTVGEIDTELSSSHGSGAWGAAGGGAINWTYTLISSVVPYEPIPDCEVWLTSDEAGLNIVVSGFTNAAGEVTFDIDAGTYYVWRRKTGWNFDNPDTEIVS